MSIDSFDYFITTATHSKPRFRLIVGRDLAEAFT
jgi:hypothetical protein